MVKVQVSDSDWSTALTYWKDLQNHLNQQHDREKIDFLNRIIFESAGLNTLRSQPSETTRAKAAEVVDGKDDLKIVDDEIKIDEQIKTFIVEPV